MVGWRREGGAEREARKPVRRESGRCKYRGKRKALSREMCIDAVE